jgi:hypothetical protein
MSNGLQKLREPFPPNQISLLPKPTKRREEMDKLPKARCQECGGWHATSNVIHLSYVGHAALTDRLLDADPAWTWEPLAVKDGLPVLDPMGGMWIKLTVCGVTRLGYGHAGDKEGGDAIKEVIGDALRNAAMRFGAALELWHKGTLRTEEEPPKKMEPKESKLGGAIAGQVLRSLKEGSLTEDMKRHVEDNLKAILDAYEVGGPQGGFERIEQESFDDMQKLYLSTLMERSITNAITAYSRSFHSKKAKEAANA